MLINYRLGPHRCDEPMALYVMWETHSELDLQAFARRDDWHNVMYYNYRHKINNPSHDQLRGVAWCKMINNQWQTYCNLAKENAENKKI